MDCDLTESVQGVEVPRNASAAVLLVRETMEKAMRQKFAILEGMAARVARETGLAFKDMTLYETATPEGMKWWVGEDLDRPDRKKAIIQEFLDEAEAHFKAELERLKAEVPDAARMTLSEKKAIEGARWTMYHCKTLSKYLKEKADGPKI